MSLEDVRRNYRNHGFGPANAAPDPMAQFDSWFLDAEAGGIEEPHAMVVATVNDAGQPSQRHVLLRGVSERGFVFYTNFTSRKADELAANPRCGLLFPWTEMSRQVSIEGQATKVADDVSDHYFSTRPRESQLGAWTSNQSSVIAGRHVLEAEFEAVSARFGDGPVPRPAHWGGFEVAPQEIEFWQGGAHRLHDRVVYTRSSETPTGWVIERRSP